MKESRSFVLYFPVAPSPPSPLCFGLEGCPYQENKAVSINLSLSQSNNGRIKLSDERTVDDVRRVVTPPLSPDYYINPLRNPDPWLGLNETTRLGQGLQKTKEFVLPTHLFSIAVRHVW